MLKKDDLTLRRVMSTKQKALKKRLDAMIDAMNDERLRWLIGKKQALIENGEISPEEYETLIEGSLQTEMERKLIINELKTASLTTSEISQRVHLPSKLIFKHMMALIRYNVITIIGERDGELEFQLL